MSDVETLVHDAIAANVDLMAGSPRIVERVVASATQLRRRRNRARAMTAAVALTTAVAGGLGIARALGWRILS
jgi:hypothetical protein